MALVGVVEEVEVDELLDLERLRRHILDNLREEVRDVDALRDEGEEALEGVDLVGVEAGVDFFLRDSTRTQTLTRLLTGSRRRHLRSGDRSPPPRRGVARRAEPDNTATTTRRRRGVVGAVSAAPLLPAKFVKLRPMLQT